jgi:predicted transcriptional regulator
MPGETAMTSLTIELPDETYRQLRQLAEARGISLDHLIEHLGSAAVASHSAETRFRSFVSEGNPKQAREILDRLDHAERQAS